MNTAPKKSYALLAALLLIAPLIVGVRVALVTQSHAAFPTLVKYWIYWVLFVLGACWIDHRYHRPKPTVGGSMYLWIRGLERAKLLQFLAVFYAILYVAAMALDSAPFATEGYLAVEKYADERVSVHADGGILDMILILVILIGFFVFPFFAVVGFMMRKGWARYFLLATVLSELLLHMGLSTPIVSGPTTATAGLILQVLTGMMLVIAFKSPANKEDADTTNSQGHAPGQA